MLVIRPFTSVICLCMVLLCQPLQAQDSTPDMAQIEQAWAKGDFVFVRGALEKLANDPGEALAQYRYGRVLLEGRGGPRDTQGAVIWLQKAVDQGHAPAATLLARVILSTQQDPADAAALFANAAARGDVEAQYYMGLLNKTGRGVERDATGAFNWFLAASEGGNRFAQWELAQAYTNGTGTAQNPQQALYWMKEAANAGQPDAQFYLAVNYENGAEGGPDLGAAHDWFRRAAESGQVLAQRKLGAIYLNGSHEQDKNAQEAARWLTAAAQAGDPGAMYMLGVAQSTDSGLVRDDAVAREWFVAASNAGVGEASFELGQFQQGGRLGPVDMGKAVEYYVQSAQQGFKGAADRLGQLTITGALDGVVAPHTAVPWALLELQQTNSALAQDWLQKQADAGVRPAIAALGGWLVQQDGRAVDGVALLQTAATAGDVPAQFQLGTLYTTGTGVDLDYVTAHAWLNIAAAQGHTEAAETRALIGDLMTPEQVAQAQAIARDYFDTARNRAPQTEQTQTVGAGTDR